MGSLGAGAVVLSVAAWLARPSMEPAIEGDIARNEAGLPQSSRSSDKAARARDVRVAIVRRRLGVPGGPADGGDAPAPPSDEELRRLDRQVAESWISDDDMPRDLALHIEELGDALTKEAQRCIEKLQLGDGGRLESLGNVFVAFKVANRDGVGRAVDVRILESEVANPLASACFVRAASTVPFPAPAAGRSYALWLPFDLYSPETYQWRQENLRRLGLRAKDRPAVENAGIPTAP